MHVGVLAIFYKPRNAAPDYLSKLAARMREHKVSCEPWNMRLTGDGVTALVPRMTEVRDVELGYHFQHSALPEPGGERELGIMVSRLHSPALDRNRPLWEFHLIEGLERDRFAFYVKIAPRAGELSRLRTHGVVHAVRQCQDPQRPPAVGAAAAGNCRSARG